MPACIVICEGRCERPRDSNEARLSADMGGVRTGGWGPGRGETWERVGTVEGWAYKTDIITAPDRMKGT